MLEQHRPALDTENSAQAAQEGPQLAHEQVGRFHSREVVAALELGPALDVAVVALGETPHGQPFVVREPAALREELLRSAAEITRGATGG